MFPTVSLSCMVHFFYRRQMMTIIRLISGQSVTQIYNAVIGYRQYANNEVQSSSTKRID